MKRISQKLKYSLGLVTLLSVLFIASFGLVTISVGMNHDKNVMSANMFSCPYATGGSSICTMNLFEYIKVWRDSLRVILAKDISTLISLMCMFVFFTFFNTKQTRRDFEERARTNMRLYEKLISSYPTTLFVSLFSQGILNTKSY